MKVFQKLHRIVVNFKIKFQLIKMTFRKYDYEVSVY